MVIMDEGNELLLDTELVSIQRDDEIVIAIFKIAEIDLDIAQQLVRYRIEATEGELSLTIADLRNVKNSTKKARDYFASEEGCKGIIATALLIDSPLGKMIGNFYIKISKPLRPVKLFTDLEKAKKWLNKFKERKMWP